VGETLSAPDLKAAIYTHFLTWLTAANEAEWSSYGLSLETGYAISQAVERRLRAKVPAEDDAGAPERLRTLARKPTASIAPEHVQSVIRKLSNDTQSVRLTAGTYGFTSSFEFEQAADGAMRVRLRRPVWNKRQRPADSAPAGSCGEKRTDSGDPA